MLDGRGYFQIKRRNALEKRNARVLHYPENQFNLALPNTYQIKYQLKD